MTWNLSNGPIAVALCGLVLASTSAIAQFGGPVGTAPAPQPAAETPAPRNTQPAAPDAAQEERYVYCELKTSLGNIVLELDAEKAPISVRNFVQYAEEEVYNGTIFHRVIENFMIQGGGFTPDMKQKPTRDPIKNEWKNGLSNVRGSVAMARTQVADSATTQFFINVSENAFLDQPRDGAGYAVFGKVVGGMDTVDAIRGVPTTTRQGMGDVPAEPVIIETVRVLTGVDAAPYAGKQE